MRQFVIGLLVGLAVVVLSAQATNITTSGTLPANCTVGNVYVKTGASAGFYVCLATNTWTLLSTGSGGSALSSITAASTSNTIASGNNLAQLWNWALTSTGDAFSFGETTAATGGNSTGNQSILKAATLANSTAVPLVIDNFGSGYTLRINDVSGDTTPMVISNSGQVSIGGTAFNGMLTVVGAGIYNSSNVSNAIFTTGDDVNGLLLTNTVSTKDFQLATGGLASSSRFNYTRRGIAHVYKTTPGTSLGGYDAYHFIAGSQAVVNSYELIGFGIDANFASTNSPPAFMGYQVTTATGQQFGDLVFGTRASTTGTVTPTERMRILSDGTVNIANLTGTGAATGKNVVCVDTGTGKLYASSTGVDCSN